MENNPIAETKSISKLKMAKTPKKISKSKIDAAVGCNPIPKRHNVARALSLRHQGLVHRLVPSTTLVDTKRGETDSP